MTIIKLLRIGLILYAAFIVLSYAFLGAEVGFNVVLLLLLSLAISFVQLGAKFSNISTYASIVVFVTVLLISYQLPAWSLALNDSDFWLVYSAFLEPWVWSESMWLVLAVQVAVLVIGLAFGAGFITPQNREMELFEPPDAQVAKYQLVAMMLFLAPIWLISLSTGFARGATSSGGPLGYLILFVSPTIMVAVATAVILKGKSQPKVVRRLAIAALVSVPTWEILNGKRGGLATVLFVVFVVWMLVKGPTAKISAKYLIWGAVTLLVILPATTWIATGFREDPGTRVNERATFDIGTSIGFVTNRADMFTSTSVILNFEETNNRAGVPLPNVRDISLAIIQLTLPRQLDVVSDQYAEQGLGPRFSEQYRGITSGNAGAWSGVGISYALMGTAGVVLPAAFLAVNIWILKKLRRHRVIGIGVAVQTTYTFVWAYMASGNIDVIFAGAIRTIGFYLLLVAFLEAMRRHRSGPVAPAIQQEQEQVVS